MSVQVVERFIDESLDASWKWKVIKLYGGEPTLHPDLVTIAARVFERLAPEKLLLMTNGDRRRVIDAFRSHFPGAVTVLRSRNASKASARVAIVDSRKQRRRPTHVAFTCAPCDNPLLAGIDFSAGCSLATRCGSALSTDGRYYFCNASVTIDRVFGLGIGHRSLKDYRDADLLHERSLTCRYCGFFRLWGKRLYAGRIIAAEPLFSRSWQAALGGEVDVGAIDCLDRQGLLSR
jgi:MoaA/NifB/PqqE/SkfB family radical SAM enzyme